MLRSVHKGHKSKKGVCPQPKVIGSNTPEAKDESIFGEFLDFPRAEYVSIREIHDTQLVNNAPTVRIRNFIDEG